MHTGKILIAGGGMVGTALALALARHGIASTVCERGDPAMLTAPRYDGRTSAVSAGSRRLLDMLGAWAGMAPHAGPIRDIRVVEGNSARHLHFAEPEDGEPMGHIVENRWIRKSLYEAARATPLIELATSAGVAGVRVDGPLAHATLDNGETRTAELLAVADGKRSPLRAQLGIRADVKDYRQTAIVCSIRHARPHQGVALERFLPAGPFAVLPMHDPHLSSLVWTEPCDLAPQYLALPDDAFLAEIAKRTGDWLGRLSLEEGMRFSYPLTLMRAERITAPQVALVGDAAHGIHPLAGQGVNLGFRDAAELAEQVARAVRVGLSAGDATALDAYARNRHADVFALVAATDGLNTLFSNHSPVLRLARGLGLGMVDRLPVLKHAFRRAAMGMKVAGVEG